MRKYPPHSKEFDYRPNNSMLNEPTILYSSYEDWTYVKVVRVHPFI